MLPEHFFGVVTEPTIFYVGRTNKFFSWEANLKVSSCAACPFPPTSLTRRQFCSVQMRNEFAIWRNNQWKENAIAINIPHGACSFMRKNNPGDLKLLYGADPNDQGPCTTPAVSKRACVAREIILHKNWNGQLKYIVLLHRSSCSNS